MPSLEHSYTLISSDDEPASHDGAGAMSPPRTSSPERLPGPPSPEEPVINNSFGPLVRFNPNPPRKRKAKRKRAEAALDDDETPAPSSTSATNKGLSNPPHTQTLRRKKARLAIEATDLTPDQIRNLSQLVVLTASEADTTPPSAHLQRGFLSRLWPFGPKPAVTRIILNPNSDRTLIIRRKVPAPVAGEDNPSPQVWKTEELHVLCALSDLRRAARSPAWHAMISCGRPVELPSEDDEWATLFMLRVAHDRSVNSEYPLDKPFDADQTMKVLRLINKYDASAEIRQALVARLSEHWQTYKQAVTIAWILGLTDAFNELVRGLIVNVETNANDELVDNDGTILTGVYPAAVLQHVRAGQVKCLERLLDLAYGYVNELIASPGCAVPGCANKKACADQKLGAFLRGLNKMELPSSKPCADEVPLSVESLKRQLTDIVGQGHALESEAWDAQGEDGEDTAGDGRGACGTQALWGFVVGREIGDVGVPMEFEKFLQLQRAKW